MLIVVVMISLIALIGLPKFARANARRYLDAARLRVGTAVVTARQAAIQKGASVEFKVVNSRVTVRRVGETTNLISPMPLDTLYRVRAEPDSLSIVFNGRGFVTSSTAAQKITLTRAGTPVDSVYVTKWGMVQR